MHLAQKVVKLLKLLGLKLTGSKRSPLFQETRFLEGTGFGRHGCSLAADRQGV